jgi:hypothetical protein
MKRIHLIENLRSKEINEMKKMKKIIHTKIVTNNGKNSLSKKTTSSKTIKIIQKDLNITLPNVPCGFFPHGSPCLGAGGKGEVLGVAWL